MIQGDQLQLLLQANDPKHAVDEAYFFIVAYKKNLFDLSLVNLDTRYEWYSPSVVAIKMVKVSLLTCRI